jgi:hypothetical protein
MQKILFIFLAFLVNLSFGQNNIITYDFGSTPQSLMLNPSYDMGAQYHITIPFIGDHKFIAESSGINAFDLFAKNSIPFQEKVKNTIYALKPNDYLLINQKAHFINVGQRINKDTYLSYGLYFETDLYSALPVEMLRLFFEGTTFLGKKYNLDGFNMQTSLAFVYHIGLQRKLSKKVNIGGRIKLYKSIVEADVRSKGSFETIKNDGTYTHNFSNIDFKLRTAGIPLKFDEDNKTVNEVYDDMSLPVLNVKGKDVSPKDYYNFGYLANQLFFSGGKGIGVDFGVTYKIRRDLVLSGSLNDFGLMYHSKLAQSFSFKGDYSTEGITFEYDPDEPLNYLERLKKDFDENVPLTISNAGYLSIKPFSLQSMLIYSIGVNRGNKCNYYRTIENSAANKIGTMLYAQYRPGQIIYDAGLFYERNFGNFLYARVNYTLNNYSYNNLGLSVATQLGKFNMFIGVNNILKLGNLAKSNNVAFHFGINIVSKNKRRY